MRISDWSSDVCSSDLFLEQHNQDCEERDAAYNLDQAKVAIGSGGVTGAGLFEGTQTRLYIVPEQHTDFIFTDRKSVAKGKSVSVRVDLGGRRTIKTKKTLSISNNYVTT